MYMCLRECACVRMYRRVPVHMCVYVCMWVCACSLGDMCLSQVWCFLLPPISMTNKASFQVEVFPLSCFQNQTWDFCEAGTDSFALCQPSMAWWEPRAVALTLQEFPQLETVSYLARVTATPLFALATCLGEACLLLYTINRKMRSLSFHWGTHVSM